MGATGQQTQDVFRADNGKHERFRVAVDGAEKDMAARFHQGGAGADHGGRVGHVLEHFQAGDHVVLAGPFFGNLFRRCLQIFHCNPGLFGMDAGYRQGGFPHIDAGDLGPAPGHAFRQQAATAADIDDFLARQADTFVNVVQAQRVDIVQGAKLRIGVPPLLGKGIEFGNFPGIHIGYGILVVCHFSAPAIVCCHCWAFLRISASFRVVSWRWFIRQRPPTQLWVTWSRVAA